jgi:hypothetical protein
MFSFLLQTVQPVPVPICFAVAWMIVGFGLWEGVKAIRSMFDYISRLHQIPCSTCRYWANHACLKCTVHPDIAMTEAAIDCVDYQSADLYSSRFAQSE